MWRSHVSAGRERRVFFTGPVARERRLIPFIYPQRRIVARRLSQRCTAVNAKGANIPAWGEARTQPQEQATLRQQRAESPIHTPRIRAESMPRASYVPGFQPWRTHHTLFWGFAPGW